MSDPPKCVFSCFQHVFMTVLLLLVQISWLKAHSFQRTTVFSNRPHCLVLRYCAVSKFCFSRELVENHLKECVSFVALFKDELFVLCTYFTCMYLCVYGFSSLGGWKRTLYPLELELNTVVNCCVGAKNWTQSSELLSHLPSPWKQQLFDRNFSCWHPGCLVVQLEYWNSMEPKLETTLPWVLYRLSTTDRVT